ncbi:MAG: hypothetical protein M1343_12560, partial [Chloroflexi bacterium]|nr:hypothetical protein [Chloroflexota bacterium]
MQRLSTFLDSHVASLWSGISDSLPGDGAGRADRKLMRNHSTVHFVNNYGGLVDQSRRHLDLEMDDYSVEDQFGVSSARCCHRLLPRLRY